jgi:transposase
VIGAISEQLSKPLFMLAKSTNSEEFMAFLKQLRSRFSSQKDRVIHLVLDNAAAHHNNFVKLLAARLKIEMMFLPAYTPELNPIEALWGIIKRDFRKRLMMTKHIVKQQPEFRQLLQDSLDAITPEVQQRAAKTNHRGYMYKVLGDRLLDILGPKDAEQVEQSDTVEVHSAYSSQEVELQTKDIPVAMTPLNYDGFDDGYDGEEVPLLLEEESKEAPPSYSMSQVAVKSRKLDYDIDDLLNS